MVERHFLPIPVLALAVILLALCGGNAPAQTATSRLPLLTIKHPDGEYAVDLRQIRAVGMHHFVVDGVIEVDEFNLDTQGSAFVRFYYARRTTSVATPSGIGQSVIDQAQEKIDQVKDRIDAARQLDRMVVKSYPTTTHARTIEFRVASKDELTKLYSAAKKAWEQQSPTVYEIK